MQNIMYNIEVAWKPLHDVFRSPKYLSVALASAAIVLVFSIWLPNLGLIRDIAFSGSLSFSEKFIFLWNSLGAIGTNFSIISATLTVFVAVLLGLNIALMVSYFKERFTLQKANGIGIVGMLMGLLGVGCASCGSLILSAFIGVGATATFAGILPLGGQEFSLLSIAILIVALYITAKKAAGPLVCKVDFLSEGSPNAKHVPGTVRADVSRPNFHGKA